MVGGLQSQCRWFIKPPIWIAKYASSCGNKLKMLTLKTGENDSSRMCWITRPKYAILF